MRPSVALISPDNIESSMKLSIDCSILMKGQLLEISDSSVVMETYGPDM